MKLIEAMKKIKALQIKAEDLRKKVANYCADNSHETPTYGDRQKAQIEEWIQAHSDILKEILQLRTAIQATNLATKVTIELEGKPVVKTIAEWIHRRRDLAGLEKAMWDGLSDKGLREGAIKTSTGEQMVVTIRRYYDPATKDKKVNEFRNEPLAIDSNLEVVNAVTDLFSPFE